MYYVVLGHTNLIPWIVGALNLAMGSQQKNFITGIEDNFIHFQLQNNAPTCLQIKGNLGKIMLFFSCCSEIPDVRVFILNLFPSSDEKKTACSPTTSTIQTIKFVYHNSKVQK
jgi:hypothetical protein